MVKTSNFFFQGGYPAKLKKVLIVTAPLWFKAPFKILRLFVREKLRERVYTVSVAQLSSHIPRSCLPASLGGQLQLDHEAWLEHCLSQQHMNLNDNSAVDELALISSNQLENADKDTSAVEKNNEQGK